MNNLSWFLYLAGLADNIKVFLGISVFATGCFTVFAWVKYAVDDYDRTPKPKAYIVVIPFLLGLLCAVLPSTQTVSLMAASEFGQRVIQSKEAQGIIDPGMEYIKNWLSQKAKETK